MIKRIKVHSKDAVKEDPHYRFPGNYGVEKFLEIFSGRSACHSVVPGQFRLVGSFDIILNYWNYEK